MAKQSFDELFLGEDHQYVFTIKNATETACVDITGWTLSWKLKRYLSDLDAAALLTKTTGAGQITITGVFNSNPATNTQVATVTILDTDTDAISEGLAEFELKRMDTNQEAVLAYGPIELKQGVHRT